jgi:hypothetical protein
MAETINQKNIVEKYKISKDCRSYTTKSSKSNPILIEFWCNGSLNYRFEDENEDQQIEFKEQRTKNQILEWYDKNSDSKYDLIRTINIQKNKAVVHEEEDLSFKNVFTQKSYEISLVIEKKLNNNDCHFYESKRNEQGIMKSLDKIGKSNVEIDDKNVLIQEWSIKTFHCPLDVADRIKNEMSEGLQCLDDQATNKTKIMKDKILNFVKNTSSPITLECTKNLRSADADAEATSPGEPNFPRLWIKNFSRGTIFHEFLHLLGFTHKVVNGNTIDIDQVTSCENCCFGFNGGNVQPLGDTNYAQQMSCGFCNGKNTNKQSYSDFMYLNGIDEVVVAFEKSASEKAKNRKQDPCKDLFNDYPNFDVNFLYNKSPSEIIIKFPLLKKHEHHLFDLVNCQK